MFMYLRKNELHTEVNNYSNYLRRFIWQVINSTISHRLIRFLPHQHTVSAVKCDIAK